MCSGAATLALVIGATSAVYAVFNTFLFRPVPGVFGESTTITVRFRTSGRGASAFGHQAGLVAMRDAAAGGGLEKLGHQCCYDSLSIATEADAQSDLERVDFVSSQLFGALGDRPKLGRLLTDDEADGSRWVVLMSECPSINWMVRMSTPSARSRQAPS